MFLAKEGVYSLTDPLDSIKLQANAKQDLASPWRKQNQEKKVLCHVVMLGRL